MDLKARDLKLNSVHHGATVHTLPCIAGHGACIALLNAGEKLEAQRKANEVEYVELAVEPSFQSHFVEAMKLPHAQDSFPHLEGMLPAKVGSQRGQRRRNRMSVPTLDTAEHTAQ